jgi:hypothetical protein
MMLLQTQDWGTILRSALDRTIFIIGFLSGTEPIINVGSVMRTLSSTEDAGLIEWDPVLVDGGIAKKDFRLMQNHQPSLPLFLDLETRFALSPTAEKLRARLLENR